MEISDAIKNRRSIREYKPDLVEKKIIEDILYHGSLAPSGHNRQPWYFIVIEDLELKNTIAELILEKNGDAGIRTCNAVKQAPALVLVYDRYEYTQGSETMFDLESIGACLENMCLKALDYNLGTLWIGLIVNAESEINELLKTDKKLLAALAVGYPSVNPSPRPRDELSELVEWK